MGERPMLFSTPLVQAIQAGRKTQTRRPVKWPKWADVERDWPALVESCALARYVDGRPVSLMQAPALPGDLLYVRETWQIATGREAGDLGAAIRYRDMEIQPVTMPASKPLPLGLTWDRWRPSIHMPRWAARIWLRVTDVRVERVKDITASAAVAEGARFFDEGSLEPDCFGGRGSGWSMGDPRSFGETLGSARMAFANAWIALYGQEAWDANPWVWAISFERVEAPAREGGR